MIMASMNFALLAKQYKKELFDSIIPFWLKHSLDRKFGGYLHCLDRDGTPFSDEKMMWMECREVWMFSHLYRTVSQEKEWLDAAKLGADFLRKKGCNNKCEWYFLIARDGTPLIAPYNIFSDVFAVMAFTEYGAITGGKWATQLAQKTFRRIQQRLSNPKGKYNKKLSASKSLVEHALPMMNLYIAGILRDLAPLPECDEIIENSLDTVMRTLFDKKTMLVYEYANPDGTHPDSPEGRLINPGHIIESMWFMMEELKRRNDKKQIELASKVMLNALEFGWDKEHSGIYAFLDAKGYSPTPLEWHMKLWWAHCEALYGCLLVYELTRNEKFLEWFKKVHDYTWAHFPDHEYGEWFGYLDRQGNVTHRYKGSRWKSFFHVPRALLYCWKKLEKLA